MWKQQAAVLVLILAVVVALGFIAMNDIARRNKQDARWDAALKNLSRMTPEEVGQASKYEVFVLAKDNTAWIWCGEDWAQVCQDEVP